MSNRMVNRRQVLGAAGVAIAGGKIATGSAAATEHDVRQFLSAELTGDGQVPPVETDASGHARLGILGEEGREVHYKIDVSSICHITQAHIHLGTRDENGPVVVWLYPKDQQEPELIEGRFDGTLVEGKYTIDDFVGPLEDTSLAKAREILAKRGAYINVHTERHPDGEIRGQIFLNESNPE